MRKTFLAALLLSAAGAAGAVTPIKVARPIVASPMAPIILVPPVEQAAVVPEPSTWAMLVVGFGLAGFGLRRNRRVSHVAA